MAVVPEQEQDIQCANLVTVSGDLVPYVLQWPSPTEADGLAEALVVVVAKRNGGMLLGVPVGFIPEGVLQQANAGHDGGPVGVSAVVRVPGVVVDGGIRSLTGSDMDVLLVDLAADMVQNLRLAEGLELIAVPFDPSPVLLFLPLRIFWPW